MCRMDLRACDEERLPVQELHEQVECLRRKLGQAGEAHRVVRQECAKEMAAARAAWDLRRRKELQVRRADPYQQLGTVVRWVIQWRHFGLVLRVLLCTTGLSKRVHAAAPGVDV